MDDVGIEGILGLSSPKVLAMYEAVNELMEEGRDIYSMKISDITAKAGIGKGTAYEYFTAKEELLGKAVFYQLHQGLMHMTEKALKQDSFRKQIYAVLEDVEQNFSKRKFLLRYLCYYMLGSCAKPCNGEKFGEIVKEGRLAEVIRCMMHQAEKEGLVKQISEFLMAEVLVTQFAGFCMYLEHRSWAEGICTEQMKEFVYRSIVRSFEDKEWLHSVRSKMS